jgi:hypothetical protein
MRHLHNSHKLGILALSEQCVQELIKVVLVWAALKEQGVELTNNEAVSGQEAAICKVVAIALVVGPEVANSVVSVFDLFFGQTLGLVKANTFYKVIKSVHVAPAQHTVDIVAGLVEELKEGKWFDYTSVFRIALRVYKVVNVVAHFCVQRWGIRVLGLGENLFEVV